MVDTDERIGLCHNDHNLNHMAPCGVSFHPHEFNSHLEGHADGRDKAMAQMDPGQLSACGQPSLPWDAKQILGHSCSKPMSNLITYHAL